MSTTIEFAVEITCQSCVEKIEHKLKELKDVEKVDISLEKGSVIVSTTLPSSIIKDSIEDTGRRAVLKGYGGALGKESIAAVAMLGGPVGFSRSGVQGVVRLVQADSETCVIEGTVDGLSPGSHGLHIHECGDISQGCDSVGEHFTLRSSQHGSPEDEPEFRHTGDLGNVVADGSGRAVFRLTDRLVRVEDVIGRSVVITEDPDDLGRGSSPGSLIDGNSGKRLACGIISRSAGLFENAKKICACDGVTLWDERNKPLAGPGRSAL